MTIPPIFPVKIPKPFDFILIDLCAGLGTKVPGNCPIDEVHEEQVVLALGKNLAENGMQKIFKY